MGKLLLDILGVALGLFVLIAASIGGIATAFLGASSPQSASPARYLQLYRAAARAMVERGCQIDWVVLAAIGKIETNHGRSDLPGVHHGANSAGARGPMQFQPATFAHYDQPIPPGGANPPSLYDPVNAIHAANPGRVLDADPATGYGLWIRIQHPGGAVTTYGHNHHNHVQAGQIVHAGRIIAEVGNRGQSSGPTCTSRSKVVASPSIQSASTAHTA